MPTVEKEWMKWQNTDLVLMNGEKNRKVTEPYLKPQYFIE
jgi:hypothetical protein